MHWFPEHPGGLSRVYYELWKTLPDAGISFRGLVAGTDRCLTESNGAIQPFASVRDKLPLRLYQMRAHFERLLADAQPDLIISHFALYTLPVIGRLATRPLVIHFQGPWADEGTIEGDGSVRWRLKKLSETIVYSCAARAIVLSGAFADILSKQYNVPRDQIDIIPGGVDLGRFAVGINRASARARLGWPPDRPIIVAVRRLVARMGLETLISAIVNVRKMVPDVLLLIAGRGILYDRLLAQIDAYDLSKHVRLLGFVSDDDLSIVYRASDVTVVPSVALEGFGLVVAESLAAGTPCLVTAIGGLPEIVSDLSENLIFPSADSTTLAQCITDVLLGRIQLPDEAQCRAYAAARFSWKLIAERTAAVYQRALE